jgi:hypothetical protein
MLAQAQTSKDLYVCNRCCQTVGNGHRVLVSFFDDKLRGKFRIYWYAYTYTQSTHDER